MLAIATLSGTPALADGLNLCKPSTQSPVDAVVEGIRELHTRHDIAGEKIAYFAHGTTIGINTLLQRSGADAGLGSRGLQ